MTAKPLSDFESMNDAEVDFCQQTFEQFSHEYTPSDTMRTIIMRLLATIRRRDELIRHARNLKDEPLSSKCELCREIEAIVEAGDG